MIRSSKITTKYANEQKKENINVLIDEYKLVAQKFVDILWNSYQLSQPIPSLLPKEITDQAQTWLSARMIQCCAKQASGIVRGTRRKYEKRLFILHKLEKENKLKQARKLKHFIKINPISKPKLENIEIELDERFVKFDFDNQTSFDGWINLGSLGNKLKIQIPIKFHKHFIQLKKQGKQLKGIRLSKTGISISFEIEKPVKDIGKRVGIDIGMKTPFTSSDGHYCQDEVNGHSLESVCKILSRKKKGSKSFKKSQEHRKNIIGFYKNQLDWNNISTMIIEDIKNLRYKQKSSRYLTTFVYREFFDKLRLTAEKFGVQISTVSPTYTSQRCSCCGWTRKRNRNGKMFKCSECGFVADADFNASVNISLDLRRISTKERKSRMNLTGFYWLEYSTSDKSL